MTTKTENYLSVGDRVRFEFGGRELEGEVVEDFRHLGGDQIVRVRAEFDLDLVRDREMVASELTRVESNRGQ